MSPVTSYQYKRIIMVCLFSTLLFYRAVAQTHTVDSLKSELLRVGSDNEKLDILLSLCLYHHSINKDSLYKYALQANGLALRADDKIKIGLAGLGLSNAYLKWGWTDSALAVIQPLLPHFNMNDPIERAVFFKLFRQKALCYGLRSRFKLALPTLYEIISKAEKYKDSLVLGTNFNTIGSISIARNYEREAINWFRRALATSPGRPEFSENLAAIYTNMANAYNLLGKNDSAVLYIEKAVPLSRQAENLNILATALRIKSNIFIHVGKVKEAETALQEMFQVRNRTNPLLNDVDDNLVIIDFYINTGQLDKAIKLCLEKLKRGNILVPIAGPGISFSNDLNVRLLYYEALAKCYKAIGNTALYQETLEHVITAKDSTYEANSATAIAEVQERYEVQKKENTIIQQNLDITRKDLDITRKNYLFYGSLILLLLVAIIAWQIFRNYTRRQKVKMLLMQQDEKRLALEAVKNAEENERKRIAADLHDNLGAYAASIASNLDYIAVLPGNDRNNNALEELRSNSQSIVSQLSDTIWALNKESLSLTAISDRVKVLLQRVGRSYPGWKLDVAEEIIRDHSLPPSQAFHLFQIIQEAVINAVKHSGGQQARVTIYSNTSWSISIADDGRGMDKKNDAANKEGGNGILNMNGRANESGWAVRWEKNDPAGTKVTIAENRSTTN